MNRKIERIAELLHGRIVLITGNHDRVSARMAMAFVRVTGPQRVQVPGNRRWGLLLSHLPAHAAGTDEPGRKTVMGNLHGHIHQRTSPTARHCNVCVEHTEYRPVRLEEALARLMRQIADGRPTPLEPGPTR